MDSLAAIQLGTVTLKPEGVRNLRRRTARDQTYLASRVVVTTRVRPARTLLARAIGLLARREHSRVELARKLQRHLGPDETTADIDRVLDRLQQQDLLSDQRFAASLVRQRSSRYGDLRLTRDLRERGVPEADAEAALIAVKGTELHRAHETWARRFDTLPASREDRGRQGRYLQARGFSMEAIVQVLAGKVDPSDR